MCLQLAHRTKCVLACLRTSVSGTVSAICDKIQTVLIQVRVREQVHFETGIQWDEDDAFFSKNMPRAHDQYVHDIGVQ